MPVATLLGIGIALPAAASRANAVWRCAAACAGCAIGIMCRSQLATDRVWALAWSMIALAAAATWLPARRVAPMIIAFACLSGTLASLLPNGSIGVALSFCATQWIASAARAALMRCGWTAATHVVASWLVAIAALNLTLALLPVTPGYLPDHLE